jgi:hypothetical protein
MTYSWNNPSSTFTTPSFGIDSAGTFSGVGDSLSSNPLSSAGGGGMAFPVGAVIGAAGSAIGGIAGGKGAKSAADQAREAAIQQSAAVKEANRENLYGSFGFDIAGKQFDFTTGNAMDNFNAFQNAKLQGALDTNFNQQAKNRLDMARNLALRQQTMYNAKGEESGYNPTAPLSRFL